MACNALADIRDSILYIVYLTDYDGAVWYYSGALGWRRTLETAKRFTNESLIDFLEFLRESTEEGCHYSFAEVAA